MSRFNLIDEKWIPVRYHNGTRDELGIRDTLLRSKEIVAIEDASPLVTAALHRFLLAVLYRALEGPTDINHARLLLTSGLPKEKIIKYLDTWRNRFWLFDEKYPFGQIPTFESKTLRAWTVLAAEHNADNAKVLFDHADIEAPGSITEGAAARWILATQTFSVSCGKSELSHTGTAPSATAAMVLPIGCDLQDTLVLSLVPQNRDVAHDDRPIWEREPESIKSLKEGIERTVSGYSDLYTWRVRSIRLLQNDSSGIERLAFASGVSKSAKDQIDPMVGYRIDDKNGKLPIQFRDRGLWREFASMLPDEKDHLAPMVIEHATTLTRSNPDRFPRSVMVWGQTNKKAKIEYWRMERFALPAAILGDRQIRTDIKEILFMAEETQKYLWWACSSFARDILSRGDREPAKEDIKKFIAQLPVNSLYWSELEAEFHTILKAYTLEKDYEDIRCQWMVCVRDAMRSAWEHHRASVSMGDAWVIRAIMKAERIIARKLKELDNQIAQYKPQKEVA
jgi:CRISPR system Cascade subunit CasA